MTSSTAPCCWKDESGELHIQETTDWGGGRGAAIGGVAGATIGLLAGPSLVVPAAVGALIGGLASKLHDSTGIPTDARYYAGPMAWESAWRLAGTERGPDGMEWGSFRRQAMR